ncbi:error-prone DNA polymerase [Arcanobacterium haemolyticum]|nr:error-prone DNA polymerase [Arcanobacterium haemolyticum]
MSKTKGQLSYQRVTTRQTHGTTQPQVPSAHIPYAELHCHSAYSFLDGASMPDELVTRAAELGLEALCLTDHNGFPGVIQLATAARHVGMPVAVGTELTLGGNTERSSADPYGEHILLIARNANGYRSLSHTIGQAMLESGQRSRADYSLQQLGERSRGAWVALTGCRKGRIRRALEQEPGVWAPQKALNEVHRLIDAFGRDNVAMELTITGSPLDRERCELLVELARRSHIETVATGNVHYARPSDRPLADVLAATRANTTLNDLNPFLPANGAYLRSGAQMLHLHRDHPRAVGAAAALGKECAFDLALVAPNLPPFPVPQGHSEASWLRELTEQRAVQRYGARAGNQAWRQIDHELDVITQLGFPGYFLIVEEIVNYCHTQGIWCQGRGSAANSAVCFALGITAVDAVRHKMLFERFLSPGRSGPPDIDIDIESGRREEVIQHVYERYGRTRAAQVANVITYRPRSAIRDAARALGYDHSQADYWAQGVEHKVSPRKGRVSDPTKDRDAAIVAERIAKGGRHVTFHSWQTRDVPDDVAKLAAHLQHLPRHLGIHSGGMILCDRPIIDVCPVSWAAMPGRTVVQWDKDDCAEAGLVKFDLLGLGMLTALRISFTELSRHGVLAHDGQELGLHNLPQEDPGVYALLQAGDSVGVFQVESRAQISTLPRLKPQNFYDLVVEVALIRPGPIQGQSVSPYLRRRNGQEKITYLHPLLKPALERTLGVPLFQEQLMQITIDVAGFTPAQADRLRKAMGSKRSHERMAALRGELFAGMKERGIDETIAEEIFNKLEGFAEFGFPESHAFSFAYLVYASAWLKVHHPEQFYAGLLAAQPMGFYSPQSLVADARRHGVLVLPPDVNHSLVEAHVEPQEVRDYEPHKLVHAHADKAVRLGLSSIRGLKKIGAKIVDERQNGKFSSLPDLVQRCALSRDDIEKLAASGACASLGIDRREGIWAAEALHDRAATNGLYIQPTIPGTETVGVLPDLPPMTDAETTHTDIATTGISTSFYPTQHIRESLTSRGVLRISDLTELPVGIRVKVAGIVTHRQRPRTANGITFLSLEDETGLLNVVCSHGLWERYSDVARRSGALVVRGMVERGDGALNFVADALENLPMTIHLKSRDFR